MRYNNPLEKMGMVMMVTMMMLAMSANLVMGRVPLTTDQSCPYQPLPNSFDTYNYLGFDQSFHIHDTFFYDFLSFIKDITFNITETSAFRFYVSPHLVDVDIWLYHNDASKAPITHTADSTSGLDETIFATLTPGSYKLRLLFFKAASGSKMACPTLTIEAAIMPTSDLQANVQGIQCPQNQNQFPNLSFNLTSGVYKYDSDVNEAGTVFNIVDQQATGKPNNFTYVKSYDFTLPTGVISTDKWGVEVSIGSHFLTGGSLGIMIVSKLNFTVPPIQGALKCLSTDDCVIGSHVTKGHSTLKSVLIPGDYKLLIYDATQEKDYSISPACTIFSLSIDIESAHETETFLNCPAYSLPASFNDPGFLDDGGYLYFADDVFLDLLNGSDNVTFQLDDPSYLRVYIPSHRVDIDVEVLNAANDIVVASFKWGGEEDITANLPAGVYTLKVLFFGNNIDTFCDTFYIEVGIAPITDYTSLNYCNKAVQVTPDLSGLATLGAAGTYDSYGSYVQLYAGQTDPVVIVTQDFSVNQTSYFFVAAGFNFVLGDVRITLTETGQDDQDDQAVVYTGDHSRNWNQLFATLENGTYTLTITTAPASVNATYLPTCVPLTLNVSIEPVVSDDPCWGTANYFPTSLNVPAYLSTSTSIHITDTFLVPPIKLITAPSTTTAFTVSTNSYFRAYSQQDSIDVDLTLIENGKRVAWSNQFRGDESIEYVLNKGANYTLVTSFYKWPTYPSSNCYTYTAQISIAPQSEKPKDKCFPSILPPTNWIKNASTTVLDQTSDFQFTQNATQFSLNLPFSVTKQNALFRAVMTFDFVWNDMMIALYQADGTQTVVGYSLYNKVDILPTLLSQGDYYLRIYEPYRPTSGKFSLNTCVEFTLRVALQIADDSSTDQDTIVCPSLLFPQTFNSIGYMSALTGQQLFYQETALADVQTAKDTIKFTVASRSLVRIYVPVHATLDIDLVLAFDGGKNIASSRTTGEEIIYNLLNAGNYVIKFTYYGLSGPLPKVEDCTDFPIFISIVPTTTLDTISSITQSCSNQAPDLPDTIVGNNQYSGTFQRSLSISQTPETMTFTINQTGLFTTTVQYNDIVASLAVKLNGTVMINGLPTTKVYYALYDGGQAYLNEILSPGAYQLNIYDPYPNVAPYNNLQCATYAVSYFLNTSTPAGDTCSTQNVLPADLFSSASRPYGGPQNADGEIRFYNNHFFLSNSADKKHNYIQFNVRTKPVYMRLYSSPDPNNDIDFHLYTNGSDSNSLIQSSYSNQADESALWLLQPQSTPYTLDVLFFRVNKKSPCNYFHFELAIETVAHITENLLCPNPMPNEVDQVPPETIEFPYGQDVTLGSEEYLFSSTRVANNLRPNSTIFRYRMLLEVQAPVNFYAEIGFDYLENDFALVLSSKNVDGSTTQITQGQKSLPTSSDATFNFLNMMSVNLTAGNYYLDINEDMRQSSFNISSSICHFFSFHIVAESVVDGLAPRMLSVIPPSGYNMNPAQPLVLNIKFSEGIGYNLTQSLLSYVLAQNAVYLTTDKIGTNVQPNSAQIKNKDKTTLVMTFFPVNGSTYYQLYVDSSKFTTVNGIMFAQENTTVIHTYNMFKCNCNGHGTCLATNGVSTCVCTDPWAGSDCSKCKNGYHGIANGCAVNTKCTADSCSGNGVCTDQNGYPECRCATGFTTTDPSELCGDCDYGYYGYPNCSMNSDDEGTLCIAPLLPSTLNYIEYLNYNGRVHMQDNYYIDMDASQHTMTFYLTEPSVFRIYAEPHRVDIDLWLYSLNPDGTMNQNIDRGISFGHEEVLVDTLQPGNYSVVFKYYLWDRSVSVDCETFNMELAIDTVANLAADQAAWVSICDHPALPNFDTNQTISVPMSYFSTASFVVPYTGNGAQGVYTWNITFNIAPTTDGQVAVLDAAIGYQFLQGELALVLQSGTGAPKCKGGDQTGITGCVFGDNEVNRNVMRAVLQPGAYTLYIYAPAEMYGMACAIFDIDFAIKFITDEEDYFNCDGDLLPLSFDSDEFLRNGSMHIQDLYFMDAAHHAISFTLDTQSYFRMAADQDKANITLQLYDVTNKQYFTRSGSLFVLMAAGDYILNIDSDFIASSTNFCPLMNMEIAIQQVILPTFCPTDNQDDLPSILNARVPYTFENGLNPRGTYYTFKNTTQIAIYSFTLTAVTNFYSAVASDFISGDLRVNLYRTRTDGSVYLFLAGFHDYNYNWINANLDPGNYFVKIERPGIPFHSANLPRCTPFEFEFALVPLSQVAICGGERVPQTLNSVRFLGNSFTTRMHYESSNFIVPPSNGTMYSKQDIPFNVPVASIMRVYTSPNAIDIDIKLIDPLTNSVIISGSNGLAGEETFITTLVAKKQYILELQFWRWSHNIPVCNNFNMEIAIAPVPSAADACPNGGAAIWPPAIPAVVSGKYWYSNIDSNQPLYFQQSTSQLASSKTTFRIPNPANFHAQVGYDFLTGDLSLKLVSETTKKIIYGDVRPNRNILDVQGLPAGTYSLYIYEPFTSLPSIMGCSNFNFEVLVDSTEGAINQDDGFNHLLPRSLDTYGFLRYNDQVHLQGEYLMFDGDDTHNTLQFTLKVQSLVRVQAAVLPSEEADIYTTISVPGIVITTVDPALGSMIAILDPGTYTLNITAPFTTSTSSNSSVVDLELAIEPLARVQKDLLAMTLPMDCPTSTLDQIVVNPTTNTYMYNGGQTISNAMVGTATSVQIIQFTIVVPSLVYVQVGYQFLTADLDVEIAYVPTAPGATAPSVFGRSNRNVNEINAVLPVGTYNIHITNPVAFPITKFDDHCTPYHLIINIRDASQANNHIDCSLFDQLPYSLNDQTSVPFGGPIDGSGTLLLYSPNFLIPLSSMQNVTFYISEPTLVNVFTSEQLSASIDYQLISTNDGVEQPILQNTASPKSSNQRSALYLANTTTTTQDTHFTLSMLFTGKIKDTCPNYAMQLAMMPVSLVYKNMMCPPKYNTVLPSNPKLNDQGYAAQYLVSSIPGSFLSPNATDPNGSGWSYNIKFAITRVTRMEMLFSYNSLVNNFVISISQLTNTSGNPAYHNIGYGSWSSQYTSGATTLTQSLTNSHLNPGQYIVTISHPPMDNMFTGASLYGDLCFPYIYSMVLLDAKTVYAGQVSPASGYNLSPQKDLIITVAFSEPFNSTQGRLTCANGVKVIKSAFYIMDTSNNNPSGKISTTTPQCLSSNGLTWGLTFVAGQLKPSTNYLLSLNSGYLYDDSGSPAVLPPQHQYSMIDTTCSGSGNFANDVCTCNTGYTGVVCEKCAAGYADAGTAGQAVCVLDPCHLDTCGCNANFPLSCSPIGQCRPTETGFTCDCPPAFNGTQCQACAAGYTGFPYCKQNFDCGGCNKGSCDHNSGSCSCPSNFQGYHCESCAPGYYGSDCKKDGSGAIIALEVIAGVVAAALVIGGAAWYVRHRFRAGVARYKMLPKFEIEDDDENPGTSSRFPGLYDSDEDENNNNNNRNNGYSINSGGGNNKKQQNKQHTFSFNNHSTSVMDDSDDDQPQQPQTQNQKMSRSLFDDM